MIQKLWIPGRFPGMNEIVRAAKSGRGKRNGYSRMKKEFDSVVVLFASRAGLEKVTNVAAFGFQWFEPNARRDPDNVACGMKFVLDGLVAAGIIQGDSRKFVGPISVEVFPEGAEGSGVMVTITD